MEAKRVGAVQFAVLQIPDCRKLAKYLDRPLCRMTRLFN